MIFISIHLYWYPNDISHYLSEYRRNSNLSALVDLLLFLSGLSDPLFRNGLKDPLLRTGLRDPLLWPGLSDPLLRAGLLEPLLRVGLCDPLLRAGLRDVLLLVWNRIGLIGRSSGLSDLLSSQRGGFGSIQGFAPKK